MRLLQVTKHHIPGLSKAWPPDVPRPRYAILSHTWLKDEEVTFDDLQNHTGLSKLGMEKIKFCNDQARKDGLEYFWVDTCCIKKSSDSEFSEAINSMFKWYQNADKCYVYLSDVRVNGADAAANRSTWITAFRQSRWFKRGWTLQELLAPRSVEFYSKERVLLGSKSTLEQEIHEITGIPIDALRGKSPTQFSIDERLAWTRQRETTKEEDRAYCLFGIFNVFLPLIYGEGTNALVRLKEEIEKISARDSVIPFPCNIPLQRPGKGSVERKDLTNQAQSFLQKSATCMETQYLLLHGLPGSGKTHLAHTLAQSWLLAGRPVYWLDASSSDSLNQSYLNFALAAGICSLQEASSRGSKMIQSKLRGYLERSKQRWLLILDNYDLYQSSNQFLLSEAFPRSSLGTIIITSRNAGLGTLIHGINQAISVQAMNTEEASELFCMTSKIDKKSLDEISRQAVAQINSELLGDLPLAIAQAGAFVGNMIEQDIPLSHTLHQYIEEYLTNRDIVLQEVDDEFIQAYGQSVITLFNMAFSTIEKKNETASKLALLFSFYNHSHISLNWFKRTSETYHRFSRTGIDLESNSFNWFRRLVKPPSLGIWSDKALRRSLQLLVDYGLLEMARDADMLAIHPLVHAWTKTFLKLREGHSVENLAHLAVAVLCEVFNNQLDSDLKHSFRIKSELWPHAEAWYKATQQGDILPAPGVNPAISGYVYNRIGDYLDSHHLPGRLETGGTVEKLRLLALQSEISRGNISSRHTVWSLRRLIVWLATRVGLHGSVMRHMAFSLINAIIDRAEPTEAWDTFKELTARAEVLQDEMMVARGDHREAVAIAKRGITYIEQYRDKMAQVDQIRLEGAFLAIIACFDAESESRLDSFWNLLRLYRTSKEVSGEKDDVTIVLLAHLANAKSFNHSNHAVASVALASEADWRSDPLFRPARVSLIGQEMGELKSIYSAERYKLLSEKHRWESEQKGEWHFQTLETESMVLDQRIHVENLSIKCPGISGSVRWLTRNDNLVLPIEIAIAMLVTKQYDRVKLLWPGYMTQLQLTKQSDSVMNDCVVVFRQAADLCIQQQMPSESAYFRSIAAYLANQIDKSMSADSTLQCTDQIYTLWQLLEKFERLLHIGTPDEQASLFSVIMDQTNTDHPILKESCLYLLIQYLLYLTYQEQNRSQALMSFRMLEKLNAIVVDSFGSPHVLIYRWKIFEAVTLRHHGMIDQAVEVEKFLQLEMVRSLEDPEESQWSSDADRKRTKDGKALTTAWQNAQMKGKKVTKFANICLERLAIEYGNRKWYSAQQDLCEQRLLAHIDKFGIDKDQIPNLVLVSVLAFSKGQHWARMRQLLTVLGQAVMKSSHVQQAEFVPWLFAEVVAQLLQFNQDRAVILLLDWFEDFAGSEVSANDETSIAVLQTRWVIASFQRMAYFRLKLSYNVDQLSKQMKDIESLIEARMDEVGEQDLANMKQNWTGEEQAWRKLSSGGPHSTT